MKKLIPFLVLLAGVTGALAQTVDFRNNQAFTTSADRDVYNIDGTPLVGTNYIAQLWYGANESSLQPATLGAIARFRAVATTNALAGTWSGGTRTLSGFAAGDTLTLVVRAWDERAGTSYDLARAAGGAYGQSTAFTYRIPTGNPAPADLYMEGLRAFSLVPEPSVIGLGLIGVGALFMLRRRKA